MTNILLSLILLSITALTALFVLFLLRLRNIYREIMAFITAPGEGQPSALASTVSVAADMVSRSLVANLKTTFMGKQSGLVRAEKAIAGDIAEDMINARSPMLGAVLNSFPSLKKTLRRNPGLLDLAISKLGQVSNPAPAPMGDNGNSKALDFKL